MNAQLQAIVDEFERARNRLHSLAGEVSREVWVRRPHPARWSIALCVAHLNLTSSAFLPILDDAVARARRVGGPTPHGRYRRDLVGWLLWKMSGPPVRVRTKTAAAFVPSGESPSEQLVPEFDRLQAHQIQYARDSDGLPIDRVKVTSPFDARVRYNLFACLAILARHQHRHLWQAEQVALTLGARPGV